MKCIPVPFNVEGAKMLQHAKELVEDPDNLVAISPVFDKLLISLRTAIAESFKLKKDETSHNDVLDSFMLSLQAYRRRS